MPVMEEDQAADMPATPWPMTAIFFCADVTAITDYIPRRGPKGLSVAASLSSSTLPKGWRITPPEIRT